MAKNNCEFNFLSDDWSDQPSYVWSEKSGRQYLLDVTKEVERFYDLYIRTRHIANHLDFIFANMRWRHLASRVQGLNNGISGDINVTTFHSNPLNIAFTSIFGFIENIFEISIKSDHALPTLTYFKLHQLTHKIVLNQQEGMYSMDSGDFVLAVCHFKNIIFVVNEIMSTLITLKSDVHVAKEESFENFFRDFNIALFDLRELSIQAVEFCNSMAEN